MSKYTLETVDYDSENEASGEYKSNKKLKADSPYALDYDSSDEQYQYVQPKKYTLSDSIKRTNDDDEIIFTDESILEPYMRKIKSDIKSHTIPLWENLIKKGTQIDKDVINMMQTCHPTPSEKCNTYNEILHLYWNKNPVGGETRNRRNTRKSIKSKKCRMYSKKVKKSRKCKMRRRSIRR